MLPPVVAVAFTLALFGYFGVRLHLIHVLSFLLVLGIGIDYTLFFAESKQHPESTMLAIFLSSLISGNGKISSPSSHDFLRKL